MRFRPSLLLAVLLALAAIAAAISPALAVDPSFSDVPSSHPYSRAIGDLAGRQIINGFPDGTFGPDRPVTRQQFAKMILLTLGMTPAEDDWPSAAAPFVDMGTDDPGSLYPHEFVALAALYQITKGKDATHFAPLDNISRAQVITMVVRAAQRFYPQTVSQPGNVASSTWGAFDPTHAQNAAIAEANNLLAGLGADPAHPAGNLSALQPFDRMTRGEVAVVLENLLLSLNLAGTTTTTSPDSGAGQGPGDLMHVYWTAADGWRSENVSALTGVKIAGPPVRALGSSDMLVARGVTGDLLTFSQSASGAWTVKSLTQGSGKKVAGPLTYWMTCDTKTWLYQFNLAGPADDGDLLRFWWGYDPSNQTPVTSENLTALTGRKVQGQVDSYTTYSGGQYILERIVARSPSGDLLMFSNLAPGHEWTAYDVSAATGKKIKGSPVTWRDAAIGVFAEDHLAAVGTDGHLLHFWWTAPSQLHVEDLSAAVGGPPLSGELVEWSLYGIYAAGGDHIGALGTNGHLLHFWRVDAGSPWQMEDITALTGRTAWGPLAAYWDHIDHATTPLAERSFEHVVAKGEDGHLLVFWDELGKHDWKVADLTALTYDRMDGPFTSWATVTPDVTHLAGIKR